MACGWLRLPWLARSPLAPSVPLEGSDTVTGLRALERAHLAEQLAGASASAISGQAPRQRAFSRYRGQTVEQLTLEDLKTEPRAWQAFWSGECGNWRQAYNVPASVEVLNERVEENFVTFLPNYLRLSLAVLLLTFYLRPRALLGAAAVGYSTYRALARAYRQHAQRQQQEQQRQRQRRQGGQQEGGAVGTARVDAGSDQIVSGLATVATWVLVAYTRCMPILLLGSLLALLATLLHTALRKAPSEHRYSGRQPLGFGFGEVLRGMPAGGASDPRNLFRQIWRRALLNMRLHAAWVLSGLRLWTGAAWGRLRGGFRGSTHFR